MYLYAHNSDAATVTRIISPGGFEVWYLREPSVPVIAISVGFQGGSALDPLGKAGLANFTTSLLDEGSGKMDAQAFQEKIIDNAIQLNFRTTRDMTRGSLKTLTKNRDEAFRLFGLALTQPRFDLETRERVLTQLLSKIEQNQNNPNSIASKIWFREIFGDHPYALSPIGNAEDLRSLQKSDLHKFVKERITKSNIFIGASGDVEPEEIARLVDLALSRLPSKSVTHHLPKVHIKSLKHTEVVEFKIPQSVAVFGFHGIPRDHKEFYAAYVMNYILGGSGFTSRLYREIREKRGLAYSVYSYLHTLDGAGLFLGGVATRNDSISESLDLIKKEIHKIAEYGVSEEELSNAKQGITGAFPLRFDSADSVAEMLVSMKSKGLRIDYLENRNSYIEAVTVADVQSVAKLLFDGDQLVTVVVGLPVNLKSNN